MRAHPHPHEHKIAHRADGGHPPARPKTGRSLRLLYGCGGIFSVVLTPSSPPLVVRCQSSMSEQAGLGSSWTPSRLCAAGALRARGAFPRSHQPAGVASAYPWSSGGGLRGSTSS